MAESESPDARLLAIAKNALRQTKSGKFDWVETDNQDAFLHTGESASIVISRYFASDNYTVRILNAAGRSIEELSSRTSFGSTRVEDELVRPVLVDLYDIARRTALQTDQVLDDLLAEVSEDDAS